MNLQHERVQALCEQLRLPAIAAQWPGLAQRAVDQDSSYGDFLEQSLRAEMDARTERTRQTLQKLATLPSVKTLEQFDFGFASGVSKPQVLELASLAFLERAENVVLLGPSGVGKTHLAIGIGHKAVQAGYKVLFRTALALVEDLELAEMKGELKKRLNQLSKYDVLIIDELGYLPMTRQARYNLFQLINNLYEYRSVILTTNKDFTSWGEFFHDDNVAVPIIDRVIHHSHIFMLGGESYRLKQKVTS